MSNKRLADRIMLVGFVSLGLSVALVALAVFVPISADTFAAANSSVKPLPPLPELGQEIGPLVSKRLARD